MKTPPNKPSAKPGKTIIPENTDVIDLADVISQGTEFKAPANNTGNSEVNENKTSSGEEKTEASNTVNHNDFEEIKAPQEPVKPIVVENIPQVTFVESAKTMVMTFDLIQQIGLPIAHKMSMFKGINRQEWQDLKDSARLYKNGKFDKSHFTDEQFLLISKFLDFITITDEIPFSEKEIDCIATPLALMLQKYQMQAGPEAALITAVLTVMGSRIMPFFFK